MTTMHCCTPEIRRALRDRGVVVTWLFGSRARGDARPDSDTDLAVLAHPDRSPLQLLELVAVADGMRGLVPGEPDVVAFERAPLGLQARIVLEGHVLCSDDEALRVVTTVLTQSRWEDVRPALIEMDHAYLAGVAARGLRHAMPR